MPATPGALEEAQRRRGRAEKAEQARAEREERGRLAALEDRADDPPARRRGRQALRLGRRRRRSSTRSREARDLRIDRRKVRLEQPIREIGTHMVEIELADGTVASVKTIVAEES